MSHVTIIISSNVVAPALTDASQGPPIVRADITYSPTDDTSPQECGRTVTRILRRLPGLADAHTDE